MSKRLTKEVIILLILQKSWKNNQKTTPRIWRQNTPTKKAKVCLKDPRCPTRRKGVFCSPRPKCFNLKVDFEFKNTFRLWREISWREWSTLLLHKLKFGSRIIGIRVANKSNKMDSLTKTWRLLAEAIIIHQRSPAFSRARIMNQGTQSVHFRPPFCPGRLFILARLWAVFLYHRLNKINSACVIPLANTTGHCLHFTRLRYSTKNIGTVLWIDNISVSVSPVLKIYEQRKNPWDSFLKFPILSGSRCNAVFHISQELYNMSRAFLGQECKFVNW